MVTVDSGTYQFELKTSFEDLTPEDWVSFAKHWYLPFQKMFHFTEEDGSLKIGVSDGILLELNLLKLLQQFSDLPRRKFLKLHENTIHEILHEYELMQWINNPIIMKVNPLPTIGRLQGPLDDFNVLCIAEFVFLDQYYQKWKDTRDDKELDLFLAVMYRKRGKSVIEADTRETFAKHTILDRLHLVSDLPEEKKILPLMWFEYHRSKLPKIYQELFRPDPRQMGEDRSSAERSRDWMDNILAMSGGKFGDFKQTEQTPVLYFLQEMDRLKREAREMKERRNSK